MPGDTVDLLDCAIHFDPKLTKHRKTFERLEAGLLRLDGGYKLLEVITAIWRGPEEKVPRRGDWVLMPAPHTITSTFRSSTRPSHRGVDIAAAGNPLVFSVAAGEVLRAGGSGKNNGDCPVGDRSCGGGWGNFIETSSFINGEPYLVRYCHLAENSILVRPGDLLQVGDAVGKQGDTGNSYGAHLHLECQNKNGQYEDPIGLVLTSSLQLIAELVELEDVDWHKAMMGMKCTGASAETASQDGHFYWGVEASEDMALSDLGRIRELQPKFELAGRSQDIPPAILAAIASRESRCGAALVNGWGDRENAWGVMQVDRRFHKIEGASDPSSLEHIQQAASIFSDYRGQVRRAHPSWSDSEVLKGAIAAYNFGPANVQTVAGMDIGSTGGDYSGDTGSRAKFIAKALNSPG